MVTSYRLDRASQSNTPRCPFVSTTGRRALGRRRVWFARHSISGLSLNNASTVFSLKSPIFPSKSSCMTMRQPMAPQLSLRAMPGDTLKVVKAVLQTENQHSRQRKARPIMLSHARGEFVADCDGDDMWIDPHKLTKQVGFLRDHPSFVLTFHNAVFMTEDGRMLDYFALPKTAQRDYSSAELRVLQWGFMLMGTVVHRNVGLDFPPEYSLAPNGDNFVPMLLAPFGGAKFQPEVGPLARRLRKGSMWASKSQAEKNRMLLQTYLQIAGYFVRIGEVEAATTILIGKLSSYVGRYLGVVPLSQARRRNALPPALQNPSSNGRRERRAGKAGRFAASRPLMKQPVDRDWRFLADRLG